MLSLMCALWGAALVCWPSTRAAARLRVLHQPRRPRMCVHRIASVRACALGAGVLAAFLALGVAGAVAGALLGGTGWRRWRTRRDALAKVAAVRGVVDALGNLVAELRAGVHPALAAESVAEDAAPEAARALRAIAASARLGGEVDAALVSGAVRRTPLHGTLERLTMAWTLAQRHGLPLAEVLDAARRDLEAIARCDAQLHAKLAGPRASATVLAVLPLLGLALGEAMGARPVHVLASSAGGQVLMLLGGFLIWAGVAWSARLTRPVLS